MGLSMRIATGTECIRRWYDLKPGRILEVKTGYKTAIGHLFGGAFLLYIL